ncbi:phage tail protein [Escherichia coli]|nr:phage tail protein [Escherichia coli]
MSQTAITQAFEQWKAQQGATGESILLDEFVFANVPGLDPSLPVDRSEQMPPAEQIVHREAVSRSGVVNENAVVHSTVLGADVGDFSFNWIGLINKATGTLAMIVHAPEQQKLRTKEGQQGNVLTRSFLMEYNGAQAETGINTPAETWQIDFTARMAGMDERQRLENVDIYGSAAFFGDGWLVGKTGNQFFVTSGVGYVAGLRAELAANQNVTVTTKPVKIWLDISWSGSLTSAWEAASKLTVATNLENYEKDGVAHYVFALASINADGAITDLRPMGSLDSQKANSEFMSRNKNLADVENIAEARKSLELKGAALLDIGTKNGTVAAGDDPRIVNAFPNTGGVLHGSVVHDATTDKGAGLYWRLEDGTYIGHFRKLLDASGNFIGFSLGNDSHGARELFMYNSGMVVFPESFRIEQGAQSCQLYPDGNLFGTKWQLNGADGWIESYFNTRFLSGMRVGAVEFSALYNGYGFSDVPGYFITGVTNDGNASVDGCQRRPLQFLLNNQWFTVGG